MSENVVCQKYFIISCHCKFRNMIWKDAVPWHDDDNVNVKKKDRDIWQMLRSLEKSSLWGLDQILQMGEFEKLILQRLQIYLKYLYKSVKNWSTTYCRAFKILFLITKEIDNFLQKHIGIWHKSHTNEQLRGPILLCCLVPFNIEVVIMLGTFQYSSCYDTWSCSISKLLLCLVLFNIDFFMILGTVQYWICYDTWYRSILNLLCCLVPFNIEVVILLGTVQYLICYDTSYRSILKLLGYLVPSYNEFVMLFGIVQTLKLLFCLVPFNIEVVMILGTVRYWICYAAWYRSVSKLLLCLVPFNIDVVMILGTIIYWFCFAAWYCYILKLLCTGETW